MFKYLLLLLVSMLLSPQAWADPLIHALLRHESQKQRSDGVTETYVYQEQLIRSGDDLWVERVLPKSSTPTHSDPAHETNLQVLPRWSKKLEAGAASLNLVNPELGYLVAVKSIEFSRLGFSGNWATESHLIDPANIRAMKPIQRRSPKAGAHWLESRLPDRYSRVLWDDALQFPLAIETGTTDGRIRDRTTVTLKPKPGQWPWLGLELLPVREIDDFGD